MSLVRLRTVDGVPAPVSVKLSSDEQGYRTYAVKFLIEDPAHEGPYTAFNCPGLPLPGTLWTFRAEADIYAWCRADAELAPHMTPDQEPVSVWAKTMKFSSKPPTWKRCWEDHQDNPLLEPPKLSGGFTKYTEEGTYDRFNKRIVTSSHEQIRGQQNEWDAGRPTVTVEQNVISLQLGLCSSMMHHVNQAPLWGLNQRVIKLSDFTWEEKWWGVCYKYYTRKFTFDIDFRTWDRNLLDEGTKALHGVWSADGSWQLLTINGQPPDPLNPAHFDHFKDKNGENCRVILNKGVPAGVRVSTDQHIIVNTVALTGADTELTLLPYLPPLPPRRLAIHITDADRSIKSGLVTLYGFDDKGGELFETVEIATGTGTYVTTTTFDTLHNDATDPGKRNYFLEFTGAGTGDTLMIETAENVPQAGYVRIEKYDYADFLQLGIPTTFG